MHGVCCNREIQGREISFSRRKSDLIFTLPEGNQTSTRNIHPCLWVNCQNKIFSYKIEVNGASDHNSVEVVVAARELALGGYNVRKRSWKDYDKVRCINKFKDTDWTQVLT